MEPYQKKMKVGSGFVAEHRSKSSSYAKSQQQKCGDTKKKKLLINNMDTAEADDRSYEISKDAGHINMSGTSKNR